MRLAQIARKVKVTPNEIRQFLEKEFELQIGKDPNYKLESDHIEAVINHNPTIEEPTVEPHLEKVAEESKEIFEDASKTEEEESAEAEKELIEDSQEENSEEVNEISEIEGSEETEIISENNESTIENSPDEVIVEEAVTEEEIDFTEVPVDPDAELIKAPKVKLDGLKILGKIELPEKEIETVPEKTAEELDADEQAKIDALDAAMQSSAQDIKASASVEGKTTEEANDVEGEAYSEYKDKRGNYHFSTALKHNRIKSLEAKNSKAIDTEVKEKKKRHYEDLMRDRPQKTSAKEVKIKAKRTEITKKKKESQEKPKPKGLWARFVHWLND